MSKRCLIISGGEYAPFPPPVAGCFVIACDRGYEYARRAGIRPDLVVGDFDSCSADVEEGVELLRFPPEKDDTDTMLALRIALARGCREIRLVCALGGRLDHTLANLQALVFAAEQGCAARICSPDTEITALREGSLRLPRREGFSLSVFAADGVCRGVCLRGAKYPLEDAELRPGLPLGVSNEWSAPEAEISVREGTLLIVEARIPG
ncbi:MAG: thiamine diphosphokinase [Oscillospiraceae bacterium]|nr:thiamine diphosphokinase [Oscillospiraceae bacterium]